MTDDRRQTTISSLRLQNFRSYIDDSFEFNSGVNIIVGPNASGKTNLLEAVLVSCLGNSYRARDSDLIRFEAPWARLDAFIANQQRTVKLVPKSQQSGVTKTLIVDEREYKRFTLQKTVPAVVFEPHHLSLLSGPPEIRRQFIDDLLDQSVPGFITLRNQYKRTLAQRNALLKSGRQSEPQLFAWNIRLSELGGRIFAERQQLITTFNKRITEIYGNIAHSQESVELVYSGTCPPEQYGSYMLHKLEANTELDYQRGFTSCGPHRDDIVLCLNDHRAQETASRGETRSLILTLKILELQLLEEARGHAPILLLDDVFSELDGSRRRALTRFLQPYQTFITTTDADVVVQHFMNDCHIIPIS